MKSRTRAAVSPAMTGRRARLPQSPFYRGGLLRRFECRRLPAEERRGDGHVLAAALHGEHGLVQDGATAQQAAERLRVRRRLAVPRLSWPTSWRVATLRTPLAVFPTGPR